MSIQYTAPRFEPMNTRSGSRRNFYIFFPKYFLQFTCDSRSQSDQIWWNFATLPKIKIVWTYFVDLLVIGKILDLLW